MQFTDTRIYSVALEVVGQGQAVSQGLPGYLADQLRRAAASIVLNFAEGSGKRGPRDRQRFFHIARGSAHEVAAVIDVAQVFGLVAEGDAAALKDRCDHVCAMLWRYR